MRLLLIFVLGIYGTRAIARVFRESPAYRAQYHVPAAAHPGAPYPSFTRRILRSPGDPRYARSRVFRNVVVNANAILDEPRLRAQGRFYKRAQAVPIHDVSQQHSQKDSIQIAAYSYDEERHHEKKLSEDSMTMVEAHDFAKNLERTTVSVKREETTTPISTTTQATTTRPPPPRPEFQQPPAAFAQPAAIRQVPGARTFSQTVQAGGQNTQQVTPVQGAGLPQPQQILPGRPPVLPQPFPQQPPFPNGLIPAIPGNPSLPNPMGIPQDPLQLAVAPPPTQVQPQLPPPPGAGPQNIPNLPPPLPPGAPIGNQASGAPPPLPSGGAPPLPHNMLPPRENRFEVINQQAANSSLEQLGCGFDWITNSCKDVFNIGWCGRCHDFGNIFLHDCKCIQPLVQLPPRPQQPRPALLRLL